VVRVQHSQRCTRAYIGCYGWSAWTIPNCGANWRVNSISGQQCSVMLELHFSIHSTPYEFIFCTCLLYDIWCQQQTAVKTYQSNRLDIRAARTRYTGGANSIYGRRELNIRATRTQYTSGANSIYRRRELNIPKTRTLYTEDANSIYGRGELGCYNLPDQTRCTHPGVPTHFPRTRSCLRASVFVFMPVILGVN